MCANTYRHTSGLNLEPVDEELHEAVANIWHPRRLRGYPNRLEYGVELILREQVRNDARCENVVDVYEKPLVHDLFKG